MAKVAVIISCYQQGHLLPEAIESALAAGEHGDVEIVVVNDGSTDRTGECIAAYEVRHPGRVRGIGQANRGLSMARQAGLEATEAEYVVLLDADDRLDARMIARAVGVLKGDAEIDAVVGKALMVGADGRRAIRELAPQGPIEWSRCAEGNPIGACNMVMMRRRSVAAAGGFGVADLRRCEDWDLWVRMCRCGMKFAFVPEVFAYYRQHGGTLSEDPVAMLGDKLRVLGRMREPDERLKGAARGGQPCLDERRYAEAANRMVLHAVGELTGRGEPMERIGTALAEAKSGGFDFRACADGFTHGLNHALQIGGGGKEIEGRYAEEVIEAVRRGLTAGGVGERAIGYLTGEMRREMRRPLVKRSPGRWVSRRMDGVRRWRMRRG